MTNWPGNHGPTPRDPGGVDPNAATHAVPQVQRPWPGPGNPPGPQAPPPTGQQPWPTPPPPSVGQQQSWPAPGQQPWQANNPQQSWPGTSEQAGWAAPGQQQGWPTTTPPNTGGAAPGSSRRNRKTLLIAVAVIVVLVGAGVAYMRVSGGGASSSLTAAETVTAYLEALSSGDAEKALSYNKSEPANSDLLTNEILSKQIAEMPISDIRILDEGEELAGIGMGAVKVAVKFGDQLSDSTVRLSKVEETWKIDEGVNKIEFLNPSRADETLTIFGKELKMGEAFYVFPGFVDVGSSNEYLDVTSESPLMAAGTTYLRPTYVLNDDGVDAVSTVMAEAFAACERSRLLDPPDCPVRLSKYDAVDGTVTWGKADLSGLTIGDLSDYDMTVRITGTVTIPVSYQTRDGGTQSGTAESVTFNSVDVSTSPPQIVR
ncbi:hypothetical protein MARA_02730 (plasmid) [Mycolicibacterium arabiense]|uniref:DUF4878 domain-containing protein n=1 Tax=Mycolicibacterium arabiense TaxID=1286181 RepID=A0A7I7RQP5_9MYCO|nr:DUF4878 domain-containing protein [Mycolicibacterium arabiense]MCV7372141.1 DUF4878 domain-containing protein [Mycolicibacterium arabiense]BBY46843.1 hypothetical protein MARA_02730 [Mycolicibacterium arabiense]